MNWNKLLSPVVFGKSQPFPEDGRSQFQKDFDRIVFSPAFRRLQDKTQVFPLPESDFVHTRLTHSLEVSCVGRSLGNLIGNYIIEMNGDLKSKYSKFHFGEICAAACLTHDIGNPPFGHSGEDAISQFFNSGKGNYLKNKVTRDQWNDLIKFEGNAQGFRILLRLQNPSISGGLQLSYAVLGAFLKYPKESKDFTSNAINKTKINKKYGFFQSEKDYFLNISNELGLTNKYPDCPFIFKNRHPLAFIVEAADDICYRIMDLEDGFKLSLLSFKETEELLRPFIGEKPLNNYEARDEKDKIGYLRARAINTLTNELMDVFTGNVNSILEGHHNNSLINDIAKHSELDLIRTVSKEKIYSYSSVLEREAAGYEVLAGLLDIFISAIVEETETKTLRNKNILKLIPGHKSLLKEDLNIYDKILIITDFVSGMTDSYAVSLFRKLKGISLPGK